MNPKRSPRAAKPAVPLQKFLTGAKTQGEYNRAMMRNALKVVGVFLGLFVAVGLAFLFPPILILEAGLGVWWLVRMLRRP